MRDSDGDGVIDSEDYAPRDPDVQREEQVELADSTSTETTTETDTPVGEPVSDITAGGGLAYDDGSVYAYDDEYIVEYAIDSSEVLNQFDSPDAGVGGLAYGNSSLWYTDGATTDYSGEVLRVDPDDGEVQSRFSTSYDPVGLAYGETSVWVIDITGNNIVEYDSSGTELGRFDTRGPTGATCAAGLAYFDGTLWVGTCGENPLYKFSTEGSYQGSTGEERKYTGLATTDTELLGPGPDGNLTTLLRL